MPHALQMTLLPSVLAVVACAQPSPRPGPVLRLTIGKSDFRGMQAQKAW